MSYAELWDGFAPATAKTEAGLKTVKTLIRFLKEKAALDLQYSRSLRKIVRMESLLGSAEPLGCFEHAGDSFQLSLQAFNGLHEAMGISTEQLATRVLEQCVTPLTALKDKLEKQLKRVVTDSEKLQKLYRAQVEQFSTVRRDCVRCVGEHRQARALLERTLAAAAIAPPSDALTSSLASNSSSSSSASSSSTPTAEQLRLIQESCLLAGKRAQAADQKYMTAIKQMRNFRDKFDSTMRQVMERLQAIEQQRLTVTAQKCRVYCKLQQESAAGGDKVVMNAFVACNNLNAEADIAAWVARNRTALSTPPALPEYDMIPGLESEEFDDSKSAALIKSESLTVITGNTNNTTHAIDTKQPPSTSTLTTPALTQPSSSHLLPTITTPHTLPADAETSASRTEAEKTLSLLFTKLLTHNTLETGDINKMQTMFQSAEGRTAFATVLNLQRNSNHGLGLSPESFEILGQLIWSFLDEAKKTMHVAPAQLVMIMSQTFYLDPHTDAAHTDPTSHAQVSISGDDEENGGADGSEEGGGGGGGGGARHRHRHFPPDDDGDEQEGRESSSSRSQGDSGGSSNAGGGEHHSRSEVMDESRVPWSGAGNSNSSRRGGRRRRSDEEASTTRVETMVNRESRAVKAEAMHTGGGSNREEEEEGEEGEGDAQQEEEDGDDQQEQQDSSESESEESSMREYSRAVVHHAHHHTAPQRQTSSLQQQSRFSSGENDREGESSSSSSSSAASSPSAMGSAAAVMRRDAGGSRRGGELTTTAAGGGHRDDGDGVGSTRSPSPSRPSISNIASTTRRDSAPPSQQQQPTSFHLPQHTQQLQHQQQQQHSHQQPHSRKPQHRYQRSEGIKREEEENHGGGAAVGVNADDVELEEVSTAAADMKTVTVRQSLITTTTTTTTTTATLTSSAAADSKQPLKSRAREAGKNKSAAASSSSSTTATTTTPQMPLTGGGDFSSASNAPQHQSQQQKRTTTSTHYRQHHHHHHHHSAHHHHHQPARLFLQQRIKGHSIWKSLRFWEEAFFDALNAKIRAHKRLARWHSDSELAEAVTTHKNVVFSCLGTFAHNMCEFDMEREAVIAFVRKMTTINELEDDQTRMLLDMDCLSTKPHHTHTAAPLNTLPPAGITHTHTTLSSHAAAIVPASPARRTNPNGPTPASPSSVVSSSTMATPSTTTTTTTTAAAGGGKASLGQMFSALLSSASSSTVSSSSSSSTTTAAAAASTSHSSSNTASLNVTLTAPATAASSAADKLKVRTQSPKSTAPAAPAAATTTTGKISGRQPAATPTPLTVPTKTVESSPVSVDLDDEEEQEEFVVPTGDGVGAIR